MNLNINSETSKLKEVLIGNSYNFKSPLNFRDLYDPTSLLNYLKGTYPNKFRLQSQLSKLKKTLVKYGVKVHELDKFLLKNKSQDFLMFGFTSIVYEHLIQKQIIKNMNKIMKIFINFHTFLLFKYLEKYWDR